MRKKLYSYLPTEYRGKSCVMLFEHFVYHETTHGYRIHHEDDEEIRNRPRRELRWVHRNPDKSGFYPSREEAVEGWRSMSPEREEGRVLTDEECEEVSEILRRRAVAALERLIRNAKE